jgi:hypothetical protein
MKRIRLVFLCAPFLAACGTSTGSASGQSGSGTASGAGTGSANGGTGQGSGSSVSAATGSAAGSASGATSVSGTNIGSGASTGNTTSGAGSGSASSGVSSGTPGSGSTSGVPASGATSGSSSGGVNGDAGLPPGSVNTVPADYMGKPFATNTIPGFIYVANYDIGGAGVAFCHSTTGATTAQGCMGGDLGDWCCGTIKGCNEAAQPVGSATYCPPYRTTGENAGLSHMNLGEPDCYSTTGPTWQFVSGSSGPTLDGPMVTAGTPVPQNAHATMVEDAYLSYTYTGEWLKFTVEVLAAGTYSVGALLGVPAGTELTIDFGNGITTGMFTPPTSPCMWTCSAAECGGVQKGCPETYHSWTNVDNLTTVQIPAPGTYVMTFTIVQGTINPLYFTFTKTM